LLEAAFEPLAALACPLAFKLLLATLTPDPLFLAPAEPAAWLLEVAFEPLEALACPLALVF